MNRVLACLAVLGLAGPTPADDPKPAPGAAVVVSGKPSGRILMRTTTGGKTTTVRITVLKLDDTTAVAVALPADEKPAKKADPGGADPDLAAALREAAGEAPAVSVAGRLAVADDPLVVAAVGPKGAKTVPLIRADTVTELTDANRKDFPPVGSARVEGTLVRAEVKVGPDVAKWAIDAKDPGPVPLLLPAEGPLPVAGAKVRATGRARVVGGRLAVEVTELAAVGK